MKYFVILSLILIGFTGSASSFEPSSNYFSNSEFQIYKIYENAYEFSIPYNISNAELDKINIDCNSTALIIYLDRVTMDGNLVINIPRALLDTKINEQDDDFIVIIDQLETEYQETYTEFDSRTLDIQLRSDSKVLEIIATSVGMFPEPSPCAIGGSAESPYYRLMSPIKQFKSGILIDEIQCKNGLVLVVKSINNSPACVKPETKAKLIERGWTDNITKHDVYFLTVNGGYDIPYSISGAILSSITADIDESELVIKLDNSTNDGNLIITLPRTLIDRKIGNDDGDFVVMINNMTINFKETRDEFFRTLEIPFVKGIETISIASPHGVS